MNERVLTDGSIPMGASIIVLEPGERIERRADAAETMLYVARGSGRIADRELARESVVWLELGEEYALEAGPEGLEVLDGHA